MLGVAITESSSYPCVASVQNFPVEVWHSGSFPVSIMPDNHGLRNLINVNCIIPTNTKGAIRQRQAVLLYLMLQPSDVPTINFPKHFYEAMKVAVHFEDPRVSLPYGYPITRICRHFGVPELSGDRKTPVTFLNKTSIKKSFKEALEDCSVKRARGKKAAVEEDDDDEVEEDVDRMVDEGFAAEISTTGDAYDLTSLGRRVDEITENLTGFQSDYRRDMGMMVRMHADAWRLQFGDDTVPSYYHNPYPPHDASGSSGN